MTHWVGGTALAWRDAFCLDLERDGMAGGGHENRDFSVTLNYYRNLPGGVKVALERVHRLSLLAATGAHSRTSTVELEVYCNTQSLQDRRVFLVATFYRRLQRLDPAQHPVAAALRQWQSCGSPAFGHRAAFLPRGAALCARLCRFSEFDDSDRTFFEPIPSPPPRKDAKRIWRPKQKERAKAAHLRLISRLGPHDITIYTDGSALPNPGKIGLGVCASIGGQSITHAAPIGIGSNITAELCAILTALQKTQLTAGLDNFNRVFVFSDCLNAIDLSLQRCTPTHSFALVNMIHAELYKLTQRIQVDIQWVPAHVGVPGNEAANTLSKMPPWLQLIFAASEAPNFPAVLSTFCGFIKYKHRNDSCNRKLVFRLSH